MADTVFVNVGFRFKELLVGLKDVSFFIAYSEEMC